jgi:predicted protein tyrosine phosphatase
MKRVLFVCSQNRLRSPTAEQVFASYPGIEVASAGIHHTADNPVTPELLQWAEIIFVMEKAHRNKLAKKFRAHLNGKRIICLNIPDEFEFMDPDLIRILKAKVPRFCRLHSTRRQCLSRVPKVLICFLYEGE